MIPWKIANTPEEAGLSSQALLDFLDAAKAAGIALHSVMVIKDDLLAASMHFAPHTAKTPHVCYSVSKPFTSVASGFAVKEGLLDWNDRVLDVLADSAPEGQPSAHAPHWMHLVDFFVIGSTVGICHGQACVHMPQPTHFSVSMRLTPFSSA